MTGEACTPCTPLHPECTPGADNHAEASAPLAPPTYREGVQGCRRGGSPDSERRTGLKRPPLCIECGVRFVWFEDEGLCGKCGPPPIKHTPHVPRGKQCSVDGCASRVHSRGLCSMHYQRVRKAERQQQDEQKDEGQTWRS